MVSDTGESENRDPRTRFQENDMVGVKGKSGGHNRKPGSVKQREGNVGHRAKPPADAHDDTTLPLPGETSDEMHAAMMRLDPPEHFDAARKELWTKLHLTCNGGGLNPFLLGPTLEVAAETWHRFQQLTAQIDDEGQILTGKDGARHKHPLLGPANTTAAQLATYLKMLGLTAANARKVLATGSRPINWIGEVERMVSMEDEADERRLQ
ncbi:hypothetical protein GOC32_22815 [Sinorhizobium meliloti]|nr:hypothetical protein [Sinorhizobium meliloti]